MLLAVLVLQGSSHAGSASKNVTRKADDPYSAPAAPELSLGIMNTPGSAKAPAADAGPGTIQLPSNAPHVDPMVASKEDPFYPSRLSTDGHALKPDMFTAAESCGECHKQIYKEWKQSIMGHAWEDPIYRAILKRASEGTKGATDNFCIGCHSPTGLATGTASALGTAAQIARARGVDCESCHTISAIHGLGNASFSLTPVTQGRAVKYGPRADALSPFHDTTVSSLHTSSEFCASCHNVTHPFNHFAVERTYDEWRDSPYNGQGVTCQDCHMSLGLGVAKLPGKSAEGGKQRPYIFAHTFVGGNVTLHEYYGETHKADRARELLESAATIEFVALPAAVSAGQDVTVQVKVTNVGAGHKLPTGFPEGREAWVDLQVTDDDGKSIYRLGEIKNGHTEEGTRSFKAVLGNAKGKVVDINVWEADRVLSDTRILPKGYVLVDYTFRVPPEVHHMHVTADLNYSSFPQAVLDKLLGEGTLKGQIVRMASVQRDVVIQ